MGGWALSAVIAVGAVAGLGSIGFVHDFVPIGLALTTTALGTLLPILHDNDMLSGDFGRYVLAAGAVGELFPIVAISLFLTRRGEFVAITSIPVAVGVVAVLLAVLPHVHWRPEGLRAMVAAGRAGDLADDPALVDRPAAGPARGRPAVRAGRRPGAMLAGDGPAELDPRDRHRRHPWRESSTPSATGFSSPSSSWHRAWPSMSSR